MPANVRFGFSGRSHGNMAYHCGEPAGTFENRRQFLSQTGIEPRSLVLPKQVHGGRIERVSREHAGQGSQSFESGIPDTDALITGERMLPIGVLTADCLPILMADSKGRAVAAVHAGWKSTRERIAANAAARLAGEFRLSPADIRCFLGPCIRSCCYQVAGDLAEIFPRSVDKTEAGFRLDLIRENSLQLREAGVSQENISDCGLCTCCLTDRFFSYRREGPAGGRLLSAIMLF